MNNNNNEGAGRPDVTPLSETLVMHVSKGAGEVEHERSSLADWTVRERIEKRSHRHILFSSNL